MWSPVHIEMRRGEGTATGQLTVEFDEMHANN